jgi:hypothetical protein
MTEYRYGLMSLDKRSEPKSLQYAIF